MVRCHGRENHPGDALDTFARQSLLLLDGRTMRRTLAGAALTIVDLLAPGKWMKVEGHTKAPADSR